MQRSIYEWDYQKVRDTRANVLHLSHMWGGGTDEQIPKTPQYQCFDASAPLPHFFRAKHIYTYRACVFCNWLLQTYYSYRDTVG
jgi:hypothetical protein